MVLFSGVVKPDSITELHYSNAEKIISTFAMNDAMLAEAVHKEQIDILVDLTVHMGGSRLKAFAYKPAPVQVTYLGYCATTGMKAIDYCVTDRNLDPITEPVTDGRYGVPSPFHSERLMHVNGCYWCYGTPAEAPPVNPLPAAQAGSITFGSLNNFTKLNDAVIELWSRVLIAVPNSTILAVVPGGQTCREEFEQAFAKHAIAPHRLRTVDLGTVEAYFRLYHQIDIALDPFPYNGGTTTMDATFMGIPVVTLEGHWATARAGVTLLKTLGLEQWITKTPKQYVQTITALASDLPRLAQWREELRGKITASPLMDDSRFAADLEDKFRKAWRQWCADKGVR